MLTSRHGVTRILCFLPLCSQHLFQPILTLCSIHFFVVVSVTKQAYIGNDRTMEPRGLTNESHEPFSFVI